MLVNRSYSSQQCSKIASVVATGWGGSFLVAR